MGEEVGMPWQLCHSNCAFRALGYVVFIVLAVIGAGMQNSKVIQLATFIFILVMGSASAQVVALGASNTEGHGVSSSESYPAQLQARGSSLRVTNAGVSGVYGDTTSGMLARLSSAVPEGTKIVILQFGGNDFRQGNSPANRQANIANIQQQLSKRGIRIVQADGLRPVYSHRIARKAATRLMSPAKQASVFS